MSYYYSSKDGYCWKCGFLIDSCKYCKDKPKSQVGRPPIKKKKKED